MIEARKQLGEEKFRVSFDNFYQGLMKDQDLFSQKLIELRNFKGLTQKVAGEMVGVSAAVVSRLERGKKPKVFKFLYFDYILTLYSLSDKS